MKNNCSIAQEKESWPQPGQEITDSDIDAFAEEINLQRLVFSDFMRFSGGFKHFKKIEERAEQNKINLEETKFYYSLYKENNLFAEIVRLTLQIEWGDGATIDLDTGLCKAQNGFENFIK